MKRAMTFRGVWVLASLAIVACGVDENVQDDGAQEAAAQAVRGRCQPGAACQTGDPCRSGTISCVNRRPICVAGALKPAGTACGAGMVCNGAGTCIACTAGAACQTGNPCQNGAVACSSGAPVCVATTNKPTGTACGAGKVCNGTGICVACTAGLACSTGNPCRIGVTSCASGSAVCIDSGNQPAGTACGVGLVCDGAGVCH